MRVAFLSMLMLVAFSEADAKEACTYKIYAAADQSIDNVHTWDSLYAHFHKYALCDSGGGLSEEYSDRVARLLVDHWNTLGILLKLMKSDPSFERFVIRHVDETINLEDGVAIVRNAQKRCPAEAKALCAKLAKAARAP
jgi:hypothetical protein